MCANFEMFRIFGITLLTLLVPRCFSSDLPADFPRCHIDDTNLDKCFLKAANDLMPYVQKGIPEIGVPSFDPLIIKKFDLTQHAQILDFNATCMNLTVIGLEKSKFKSMGFDPKTNTFHGELDMEDVIIDTDAIVHGRFLAIPVDGTGEGHGRWGPVNLKFEIEGKLEVSESGEQYHPTGSKVTLNLGKGSYRFVDLFASNPAFQDNKYLKDYSNRSAVYVERLANNIINQNAETVTIGFTPVLEGMAERALLWLMKTITKALPLGKMFPKSAL